MTTDPTAPVPVWPFPGFAQGLGVLGEALTEESLCRGMLPRGFRARYGADKALVYSALLFALVHLNPWQAIGAFALGLFYGWLVQRTGSLWPAVLGHALNNGLAWLAMQRHWVYRGNHRLQPLNLWVVGALFTVTGLLLVKQGTEAAPDPLSLEAQP